MLRAAFAIQIASRSLSEAACCADPPASREDPKSADFIVSLAAALFDFYGLWSRGSTLIISRAHVADDHLPTRTTAEPITLNDETACETSRYFGWPSLPNCLKYDHKFRASVSSLTPANNFFVPGIVNFGSLIYFRKTASFQVKGQFPFASE